MFGGRIEASRSERPHQAAASTRTDTDLQAPPEDYAKVSVPCRPYVGQVTTATINVRTQAMIATAERISKELGGPAHFVLEQGSYSTVDPGSGKTHSGGGAVDFWLYQYKPGKSGGAGNPADDKANMAPLTKQERDIVVKALRLAGFAAWSRRAPEFPDELHIHAVAIGDKQLHPQAKAQVEQYLKGQNGLANHGPDGDRHLEGVKVPAWAQPAATAWSPR